jgi:tetratricopeptide (TPR) repeat protein
VDRGVLATAAELFEARHYPGVVALINDALEEDPEHVPLLLVRARAHIALRRDLEAQADLRDIIRLDPQCSLAYRLLGELAARRDEHDSAAIFFREALRLNPGDPDAADWLAIVDKPVRPAAVAPKLPAPATAAGRVPRFATGTTPPADLERPTRPFGALARGSSPKTEWQTPIPLGLGSKPPLSDVKTTLPGAQPQRIAQRSQSRGPIPELPGFGDYLVESGILTRERLRAAQAYQRSMRVHLSTAIVTLGLATPQRIEWAAVAHQSQLARQR